MSLSEKLVKVYRLSEPLEFTETGGRAAIEWAQKMLRILAEREQQSTNESEQQFVEESEQQITNETEPFHGEAAEFVMPEMPPLDTPSLEDLGFVPPLSIPTLEELGFCEPNCYFDGSDRALNLLRSRLESARPDLDAPQFAEAMCQLLEL